LFPWEIELRTWEVLLECLDHSAKALFFNIDHSKDRASPKGHNKCDFVPIETMIAYIYILILWISNMFCNQTFRTSLEHNFENLGVGLSVTSKSTGPQNTVKIQWGMKNTRK
jgi:hypothetical protein